MTTLADLFNAPLDGQGEDAFDRIALRDLMATVARKGKTLIDGIAVDGDQPPQAAAALPPIPTQEIAPRPQMGTPYRPMAEMQPASEPMAPPMGAGAEPGRMSSISQPPPAAPEMPGGSFWRGIAEDNVGIIPTLIKGFQRGDTENMTARALRAKGVPEDVIAGAIVNPAIMKNLLAQQFASKRQFGLNPIFGTNERGEPMLGQLHSGGGMEAVQLPPGFKPSTGHDKVDLGTHWLVTDKKSGQTIGMLPKNVEEAARQKKLGTERGEEQGAVNKDKTALESSTSALNRLEQAANEVLTHPGLAGNYGMRGVVPNVPGTQAADAAAKLTTLKAQAGFAVLQAMRDASKTGGALGNITEQEHIYLQNALAALEKAQSYEQVQGELRKIMQFTQESKGRLRSAFDRAHGGGGAGGKVPPGAGPRPDPLGIR